MRIELIELGVCECEHAEHRHKVDGAFRVECTIEGCDCEEYEE